MLRWIHSGLHLSIPCAQMQIDMKLLNILRRRSTAKCHTSHIVYAVQWLMRPYLQRHWRNWKWCHDCAPNSLHCANSPWSQRSIHLTIVHQLLVRTSRDNRHRTILMPALCLAILKAVPITWWQAWPLATSREKLEIGRPCLQIQVNRNHKVCVEFRTGPGIPFENGWNKLKHHRTA